MTTSSYEQISAQAAKLDACLARILDVHSFLKDDGDRAAVQSIFRHGLGFVIWFQAVPDEPQDDEQIEIFDEWFEAQAEVLASIAEWCEAMKDTPYPDDMSSQDVLADIINDESMQLISGLDLNNLKGVDSLNDLFLNGVGAPTKTGSTKK